MKIMFRFPDIDMNTLIALKKNEIPITAENIQNLENYQSIHIYIWKTKHNFHIL